MNSRLNCPHPQPSRGFSRIISNVPFQISERLFVNPLMEEEPLNMFNWHNSLCTLPRISFLHSPDINQNPPIRKSNTRIHEEIFRRNLFLCHLSPQRKRITRDIMPHIHAAVLKLMMIINIADAEERIKNQL